ncbi:MULTISPECIES: glycosyltransferase [Hydrotalea]|uniref:glycosyltransferase n=1 Tax=Hydrotalea TaxID=1004300 RepID=UPI001E359400|nr:MULTISPECIES: glycosyltransferase [Hydrotalea]
MTRIYFTVTNSLVYDQRMQRICTSLANNGYAVTLIGRKLKSDPLPGKTAYRNILLTCFFSKTILFYAEYNIRLFFYLLTQKMDIICAIDADTLLPCLFYSQLKKVKRVYDAHEYFSEQKEIVIRKRVQWVWQCIEKWCIPQFKNGYTVNELLQVAFQNKFGVNYTIIRNLPVQPADYPSNNTPLANTKVILYQGAVNHGRCFETLIPAMKQVNAQLWIIGTGNFFDTAKQLIEAHQLPQKVILTGALLPEKLKKITPGAYLGLTLFEANGLNQKHSLANRFFDYIMAGIPQICVNFPAYAAIQQKYPVTYMVDDTHEDTLAAAMNKLLNDTVLYNQLQQQCYIARKELNWQKEEIKLLLFWKNICIS